MTTYLFHTTLLISGFTLFYWYILRHETYFRLNRWVILGSVLFCLALPLIHIPASFSLWDNTVSPTESIMETIAQAPTQLVNPQTTTETEYTEYSPQVPVNTADDSSFSLTSILWILYVVGVVIFLLVFLVQVVILLTQRYNLNSFQTGKYTIVEMVKDSEPCSFLNYIFINPTKYDEETYDHIIKHEKAHIDQSHFVDKVIAELLIVLFWFNPLTWLLRKSISQNLEFLTDQSLLKQGIQKDKYQMSLLKVSVSNRPLNLTASYNSSFLKNRINMMNAQNSSVVSSWKYLFILPLFVLSVASLNAVQENRNNIAHADMNAQKANDVSKDAYSSEVNALKESASSGDKRMTTKELNLPHITRIGLAMSGNLSISYGNIQKVSISGPQDAVDNISTEVIAENWNISYKDPEKQTKGQDVKVVVQLTNLTHLALSGAGSITAMNRFKTNDHLYIALSGTGNIEYTGDAPYIHTALSGTGNINIDSHAKTIETALSGSGNISLSGSANETKFISSGSGSISASELQSKSASIIGDGASSISINASDYLNVDAGGVTLVQYRGTPEIVKKLKNGAKIEKIR